MKYGICQVVISPGRAEPADQAEIMMQLQEEIDSYDIKMKIPKEKKPRKKVVKKKGINKEYEILNQYKHRFDHL